jgi:uncharacterized membrane protein
MKVSSSFNQWLLCCFAFIAAMLIARVYISQNYRYVFLIWNLFLATVPYLISLTFRNYYRNKISFVFLFFGWLLFFPNALYILTDIIHLKSSATIPLWFDAILLFTASFAGLALAFASLNNTVRVLQKKFSALTTNRLAIVFIFFGAIGVYLGRFARLNSWDIIANPFQLLSVTGKVFISAFTDFKTAVIILLLFLVNMLFWFFMKTMSKSIFYDSHRDRGIN